MDVVINTHLHADHVGWNTRPDDGHWVPTFPNARYVLPGPDVEYYDPAGRRPPRPATSDTDVFEDSVRPVNDDSGQAEVDRVATVLRSRSRKSLNAGAAPRATGSGLPRGTGALLVKRYFST